MPMGAPEHAVEDSLQQGHPRIPTGNSRSRGVHDPAVFRLLALVACGAQSEQSAKRKGRARYRVGVPGMTPGRVISCERMVEGP